MKETLQYLFEGNRLTRQEAKNSLLEVGKGLHSENEFASFLTVFKMRPIHSDELAGFRDAMFELSTHVDLSEFEAIDVVGTGGDGKNTFNISTIACFVLAGAGVNVTKHGNYAVSSNSGSSNVLEYMGYKFSNNIDKLKNDLEKGGFCFLHSPLFHPAMKHIAPVRRALKVPTFFNILGPMINPSAPQHQLLGVNNTENFEHYRNIFETLNINFAIVNSVDGYDEISLTSETRIAERGKELLLSSADFGFGELVPESLYGGNSVEDAAKIFIAVLEGKATAAQTNVVLANSALALKLINPQQSLIDCVEIGRQSIESGNALKKLKAVISE